MFKSKKGVSLITVLLFMLVATIAATATFKWLTSENRSSATRMLRQEAYKSSIAGIENTQSVSFCLWGSAQRHLTEERMFL